MTKQEEQWQAESDAQMLARYQELLDDKPRLRRAAKKAKEIKENLDKQSKNMEKAANINGRK